MTLPSTPAPPLITTLQMIGCSHHNAGVAFREQIAFSGEHATQLLADFTERFPGGELVLLSTCNRTELYGVAPPSQLMTTDHLIELVSLRHAMDLQQMREHMTPREGRDAVEHLFKVASSLDSMIVGEAQVLSQVKQAYDLANLADATGPVTHAAFQAANKAAKRVQTETSIHRRRLSVPSVAIGEIVPEVFDTLKGKQVVLCGAGEMAVETLRYLRAAGSDRIAIVNRSVQHAQELASTCGAEFGGMETLAARVIDADLLIGTTSSDEPLMDPATFSQCNAKRGGRVLLILDLAVPRDFDVAIGEQTGVYLYQIDDLRAACDRNRREREKQFPKAMKIIDEEVQSFLQDLSHRATGPVIRRLRQRADEVKQAELERLLAKINGDADPALAREIAKSFDRLTNKLLHPPMASLRDDVADGHARGLLEALRQLFNLGDEGNH